ncbi:hypothetical protein Scep_001684 [Stephania cephalantha]|uniref:Uncharacterized protein n=1 Tax=Stephania cephalantha TaxID=152367 RepID=A0AAP0Q473_9MAGN
MEGVLAMARQGLAMAGHHKPYWAGPCPAKPRENLGFTQADPWGDSGTALGLPKAVHRVLGKVLVMDEDREEKNNFKGDGCIDCFLLYV